MNTKLPIRLTTGLFLTSLFISTQHTVSAESMRNDAYIIDDQILQNNPISHLPTPTPGNEISNTIKKNMTISNSERMSAKYLKSIQSYYTFTTSSPLVDYGEIIPGEPILRNVKVSVHTPLSQGFTIYMYQDHPLSSQDNNQIPNTTCDDGACTTVAGSVWKSPLTFGLGYRCESNGNILCHSDFLDKDFYKPIPTSTISATPILKSHQHIKNAESILIYKVNVPGTQPVKQYDNSFTFLLIPNL